MCVCVCVCVCVCRSVFLFLFLSVSAFVCLCLSVGVGVGGRVCVGLWVCGGVGGFSLCVFGCVCGISGEAGLKLLVYEALGY